ncbi:MAG: hypothetical protein DME20_07245 [Verrucomicrobia bacterium]|nr:MAG: hypothetical protein DME20_07245 [Verrucomicrobiota bacterium]
MVWNGGKMKTIKSFLSVLTLALSDALTWGAEGVISKVASPSGDYCHLKFPAIREETLYWDRPVLKDASSGDIVDFYGPCDHDPLGKKEILRQRADVQRERSRRLGSD